MPETVEKRLKWDTVGERFFETGTDRGVLYLRDTDGSYPKGVAWNGLTGVSENPSGAEPTAMYADNIKYLNLYSAEEYGATVNAYTYPDEFAECDGSASVGAGLNVGQQKRKTFGLCFRTLVGNDVDGTDKGYKLHLIYGATAKPSGKEYQTVNDSPEAVTFSWEISTTPIPITLEGTNFKPTATLEIDTTKALPAGFLDALEDILYGKDGTEQTATDPRLPLPDEVIGLYNQYAGE
jgi:hypothetical protein